MLGGNRQNTQKACQSLAADADKLWHEKDAPAGAPELSSSEIPWSGCKRWLGVLFGFFLGNIVPGVEIGFLAAHPQ
jgi:hypothetical protein